MTPAEHRADAVDRARRTGWQAVKAAAVFVVVTVAPTVLTATVGQERFSEVPWGDAFDRGAYALAVGALMAVLAWAQRRRGR